MVGVFSGVRFQRKQKKLEASEQVSKLWLPYSVVRRHAVAKGVDVSGHGLRAEVFVLFVVLLEWS